MSVAYRSTCRPTIGQSLSVDISANISVECRSTYRPMLNRYVSLYVDRHISVDISTDAQPICQSICRPIYRSRGAQNTHDPQRVAILNPTKKSFSLTTKIEIFFAHVTITSTAVAHFSIEFYIRQCLHVSLVPYWCIYMYFYCTLHASGGADPSQVFSLSLKSAVLSHFNFL